uniref:Uncharacterized protein n=1 Tax=Anguilla anguilla TaxID=7936 RepID=A0A0E9XIZ7_ANGAN
MSMQTKIKYIKNADALG